MRQLTELRKFMRSLGSSKIKQRLVTCDGCGSQWRSPEEAQSYEKVLQEQVEVMTPPQTKFDGRMGKISRGWCWDSRSGPGAQVSEIRKCLRLNSLNNHGLDPSQCPPGLRDLLPIARWGSATTTSVQQKWEMPLLERDELRRSIVTARRNSTTGWRDRAQSKTGAEYGSPINLTSRSDTQTAWRRK